MRREPGAATTLLDLSPPRFDVPTVFGIRIYNPALWEDMDEPIRTRAADYGATEEEAVRGAIREALAIEAAGGKGRRRSFAVSPDPGAS